MRTAFDFFSDPSHGWLAVTSDDIKSVDLRLSDFSSCSYRKGEILYLEEDCDASLFLAAYEVKFCAKPEIIERNERGESLIRTYSHLPASGRSFKEFTAKMQNYRAILDNRAEA